MTSARMMLIGFDDGASAAMTRSFLSFVFRDAIELRATPLPEGSDPKREDCRKDDQISPMSSAVRLKLRPLDAPRSSSEVCYSTICVKRACAWPVARLSESL